MSQDTQSAAHAVQQSPAGKSAKAKLPQRIVRLLAGTAILCLILFGTAGRVNWLGAWAFVALFFLFLLFALVWGTRNAPELLDERAKPGGNVKSWDKVIMRIYSLVLISLFVVAALDAGRFRWSHMTAVWQVMGGAIFLLSGSVIFWCMKTNAFLSARARIQDDRGQTVVQDGPYQYVRHPMYIGIMVLMPGVALLLGSWWALAPAGVIAILFVIRTALEDKMLRAELPGYQEYASKVRYRLVVGVW